MKRGTVVFFNKKKGFGFIEPDHGSVDVFVHISAVERSGMLTLYERQRVSFNLTTDNNGDTNAQDLSTI
jgi:cold shock protein